MKLTEYGIREWGLTGLIALVLLVVCAMLIYKGHIASGAALAVLTVLVWISIAAFFRDPCRTIPSDEKLIVSPADGVVKDIELIRDDSSNQFLAGKNMVRIGIFLSVLDVHLNRAPAKMRIEYELYTKGAFLDARNPDASKKNESMFIGGTAFACGESFPVAIRQISGAIARRIVCDTKIEQTLEKGERYGMIKFGSRTELYIPASSDFVVKVKVGDRVSGGTTVLAELVTDPSTAGEKAK